MTAALGLLYHQENAGCELKAEGDSIRFRAPEGTLSDDLRETVRVHKVELLELLRMRERFGYRDAALFKLIDHRVATTQGRGVLLSVFRRYCRIELERTGAVVLRRPAEIISLAVGEFTGAVAA